MSQSLSPSAQKVQDALRQHGLSGMVVELPASARTAQDAAQAIGCEVAHIVKSLVFQGAHTQQGILVLASGVNRVGQVLRPKGRSLLLAPPAASRVAESEPQPKAP